MNLYRAVVSYASATTGDIRVVIPAVLGPKESIPISKIGRSAVSGTWQVPLLGSQVVVAVEDNGFSNVYMVSPNLMTTDSSSGSGGGGGGGGSEPTSSGIPPGVITQYAGSSAPSGWLFCHGQQLPTDGDYADLFNAIGYDYGGSGGTFWLPDLQGKIPLGLDSLDIDFSTLANSSGSKTAALIEANLPAHAHSLGSHTHSLSSHTHTLAHGHTASAGSNAHNHTVSVGTTGSSHSHPMSTGAALSIGAANSLFANSGNPPVVSAGTTGSGGSHTHDGSAGYDTHSHTVTVGAADTSSTGGPSTSNTGGPSTTNTGNGSGTATAFEILPPYIVVNYIIKV